MGHKANSMLPKGKGIGARWKRDSIVHCRYKKQEFRSPRLRE